MDPKHLVKKYSNTDITVVWQPQLCIHSTICWKGLEGLPQVFDPREKPWIKIDGADSERIVQQVKKCPSAALSFYYKKMVEENPDFI